MVQRTFGVGAGSLALCALLSLAGCATAGPPHAGAAPTAAAERDDVEWMVDAIRLQREAGWDVGRAGAPLAFPGASATDVGDGASWRAALGDLPRALQPASPSLQPFYVPTLFMAPTGAGGERLRAQLRPIHTRAMDDDYARGVALARQFAAVGWPRDTALVVDAPGPRAVAVAAALADHFAPVFTFGDWPHPVGVVPAHETLAATLYYLPRFLLARATRPADAPPLFVLDANRLAPYANPDTQFDNRYRVKLPTPEALAALGVHHVLYVGTDGNEELADVNGALVALCEHGLDVKMVALADFVRADGGDALAAAETASQGDGTAEEGGLAWFAPWPVWMLEAWLTPPFYYRGCFWDPGLFWSDYGYYPPPRGRVAPPRRGAVVIGPPKVRRALPPSRAIAWTARPRANVLARLPSTGLVSVHAHGVWHALPGARALPRRTSIHDVWHPTTVSGSAWRTPSFSSSHSFGSSHTTFRPTTHWHAPSFSSHQAWHPSSHSSSFGGASHTAAPRSFGSSGARNAVGHFHR